MRPTSPGKRAFGFQEGASAFAFQIFEPSALSTFTSSLPLMNQSSSALIDLKNMCLVVSTGNPSAMLKRICLPNSARESTPVLLGRSTPPFKTSSSTSRYCRIAVTSDVESCSNSTTRVALRSRRTWPLIHLLGFVCRLQFDKIVLLECTESSSCDDEGQKIWAIKSATISASG